MLTLDHVDWYKRTFGAPMTIEYDYRFYDWSEVSNEKHQFNQVYGNIIDEPIDFIGKFENLRDDVSCLFERLGVANKPIPHAAKSSRLSEDKESHYQSAAIKRMIRELYYHDFEKFGYEY